MHQEISAERERSITWLLQLCLHHKQTKLRAMQIWNPVSEYKPCILPEPILKRKFGHWKGTFSSEKSAFRPRKMTFHMKLFSIASTKLISIIPLLLVLNAYCIYVLTYNAWHTWVSFSFQTMMWIKPWVLLRTKNNTFCNGFLPNYFLTNLCNVYNILYSTSLRLVSHFKFFFNLSFWMVI